LQELPGVGEVLSHRIVSYREEHGPFASVQELRKVKGVGAKTLQKIRPKVTLEAPKGR